MIAIIDLDSTIIDTIYDIEFEETEFRKKIPKMGRIEPIEFVSIRPYAEDLLRFCNDNFDQTILCTFSRWSRAITILELFDIRKYFSKVIPFEMLNGDETLDLNHDFVLIDDSPYTISYTKRKLEYFGIDISEGNIKKIDRCFINVSSYDCSNDEERKDREMIMTIQKIEEAQSAVEKRRNEIFKKIKSMIEEIIDEDVKVYRSSNFYIDLAFDKCQFGDLFLSIEEHFNILIPDDLNRSIETVDELVAFVDLQLIST